VAEAAVVGVPDQRLGETIRACIVAPTRHHPRASKNYPGMAFQYLFDFDREHVFATANDLVALAANEVEVTVDQAAEAAGVLPAFGVDEKRMATPSPHLANAIRIRIVNA
jgi:acyl-CoA synthetase (AMP-forming)/AMP-acid ligase II